MQYKDYIKKKKIIYKMWYHFFEFPGLHFGRNQVL